MLEALLLMAACILSLGGFLVLALGQDRHWEVVTGLEAGRCIDRSYLLAVGLALQCVACLLTVCSQGAGFGVLLWGIYMTATAMLVAFVLAWRPGWMTFVALACQSRRWRQGDRMQRRTAPQGKQPPLP